MVVGQCHVMLDTFPWGAGVTSMEALSAGVPVVTLPARISVLHLAAGQVGDAMPYCYCSLRLFWSLKKVEEALFSFGAIPGGWGGGGVKILLLLI